MSKLETSVQVMVRIQPPSSRSIYRDQSNNGVIWCGCRPFTFDHIFSSQCSDVDVFQKVGRELAYNTIEGYNSCLLVYGQTGTGKTYTMTGNSTSSGLVQKTLNLLWNQLSSDPNIEHFTIRSTYLEIYNQTIRDLMKNSGKDEKKEREIHIREFVKTGFCVQGLLQILVQNADDFNQIINVGIKNRLTKSTKMNESSSRSHSIMTVCVESKIKNNNASVIRISKINFVDLAGSEKQKNTQSEGSRLKEAAGINKSLTILSTVIAKLVEIKNKNVHVPYRDSVLTKLLKDSLGGNSRTMFIGTVSAKGEWVAETISTLIFLERTKKVQNNVTINQKIQEGILHKKLDVYKEKIGKLEYLLQNRQRQLKQLKQSQFKSERKQIQVQHLKNLLLSSSSSKQIFTEDNLQRESCEQLPSLNNTTPIIIQNVKLNLQTIKEQPFNPLEQNLFGENRQKQNYFNHSERQQRKNTTIYKSIKTSHQYKTHFDCDIRVQSQIEFLHGQINQFFEQDSQNNKLLSLISQNLQNLKFSEAQVQLMVVQQKQLTQKSFHLKECNNQRQILIEQMKQLKTNYQKQILSLKQSLINRISINSQLQSNQNRLVSELDKLHKKQQELIDKMKKKEQQWRKKMININSDNFHLRESNSGLEDQLRIVQDEIFGLNASLEELKRQDHQKDICFLKTNKQKQPNLLKINQELEQDIEDDFSVQIKKLQQQIGSRQVELTARNFLINELRNQIEVQFQASKGKDVVISSLEAQLSLSRDKINELKFIIVDGQQIPVSTLLQRFKIIKNTLIQMDEQKKKTEKEQQQRMRQFQNIMNQNQAKLIRQLQQMVSMKQISKNNEDYLQTSIDQKTKQIDSLKQQLNALQIKQTHQKSDQCNSLNIDIETFQTPKQGIQQQTNLNQNNNLFQKELNYHELINADLNNKNIISIHENAVLQQQKFKQNQQLLTNLESLKAEIAKLKLMIDQEYIQSLQKEKQNMKNNEQNMCLKIIELKKQINQLKQQKRRLIVQHQSFVLKTNTKQQSNHNQKNVNQILCAQLHEYRLIMYQKTKEYQYETEKNKERLNEIGRLQLILKNNHIKY